MHRTLTAAAPAALPASPLGASHRRASQKRPGRCVCRLCLRPIDQALQRRTVQLTSLASEYMNAACYTRWCAYTQASNEGDLNACLTGHLDGAAACRDRGAAAGAAGAPCQGSAGTGASYIKRSYLHQIVVVHPSTGTVDKVRDNNCMWAISHQASDLAPCIDNTSKLRTAVDLQQPTASYHPCWGV